MQQKHPTPKRQFYNKKARFDYEIIDSLEAGLVLTGLEIKAVRTGRLDMTGSYVKIINGEVFWLGGNFNLAEGDRQRTRKLLLHSNEIKRLAGKSQEQGLALIPLKLYLKRGKAKLELGIGRGLKKYDKRAKLKKKDQQREINRRIKT